MARYVTLSSKVKHQNNDYCTECMLSQIKVLLSFGLNRFVSMKNFPQFYNIAQAGSHCFSTFFLVNQSVHVYLIKLTNVQFMIPFGRQSLPIKVPQCSLQYSRLAEFS